MRNIQFFLAVVAICLCLTPGSAQIVPLLTQDFEGTFPPAGWSAYTGGGQNQWYRNDHWLRGNFTPGGNGYCADNDDAGAGPGAARVINNCLQSTTFDATNYTVVWLAWDVDWFPVGTALQGRVEIYDGANWSIVMSYPFIHLNQRDSVNVSYYVALKSGCRVRFVYNEMSGGVKSNWFEVDDIRVWGSEPPEPLDLEMVDILRPFNQEQAGVPFKPACNIFNNLDTIAHATVSCNIWELPTNILVFTENRTNVSCMPGYTNVEFSPFTPGMNKTYTITFTVQHPDDVDFSNNSMSKNFSSISPSQDKDVTPFEMISPLESQLGLFEPTAVYEERANITTSNVSLLCWIRPLPDTADTVVYADTLGPRTFSSNEVDTLVFDTANLVTGTYIISFWARDDVDANISFPPLVDTFELVGIEEVSFSTATLLEEITPNPATGLAHIRFTLARAGKTNLAVYDASGRVAEVLLSATLQAGPHSIVWNPTYFSPGVYFVTLSTPWYSHSRSLLILH